jgi:hypothetical protein
MGNRDRGRSECAACFPRRANLRLLLAGAALAGCACLAAANAARAAPDQSDPQSAADPLQATSEALSTAPSPTLADETTAMAVPDPGDAIAVAAVGQPASFDGPVAPAEPDRWSLSVAPYLWLTGISGTINSPPPPANQGEIIIDVDAESILESLQFAAMGTAELRYGRFAINTDLIYVNLENHAQVRQIITPGGIEFPVDAGTTLGLTQWIVQLTAGYDVARSDRGYLQLNAGFRYVGVDTSLEWSFVGPVGAFPRTGVAEAHADIWDAVVGARGELALGDSNWKLVAFGDVGAGSSDLTWQVSGQIAHVWSWGQIGAGWRYLTYDQDDEKLVQDLSMSGPIITVLFHFGG